MSKPGNSTEYNSYKVILRNALESAVANASLACYRPCDHKHINEISKRFNQADNADNITLMEQLLNQLLEFTK